MFKKFDGGQEVADPSSACPWNVGEGYVQALTKPNGEFRAPWLPDNGAGFRL